ncbi:MAG: rod shape-determining protein MreD [Bacteroidales bacterium]|nr:rod shape-determining protein MreD [Bacteroidales bacterium]MDD7725513.1 rod shape-determining protein MreD [Bacteroidales bacterium]MDY4173973.1 rod shape-determining protein MreD [Bacteroidales bacterium]
MNNTANLIRLAFVLFFVLLLQIVVFDNLDFLGLCNPFIYILFILVAPFGCPTWLLMLMAGGAGLIIDVASNTPGMHAAASILIAYLRPVVLRLIAFRNTTYKEGDMPGSHAYGSMWFARYTLIIVAIHHLALFLIEQFDSFYLLPTLLRIVLSIVASTVLIVLLENFSPATRASDD